MEDHDLRSTDLFHFVDGIEEVAGVQLFPIGLLRR
jgi:hypothetical protein